jgi:prepilin-type N-terminal cleavage/methylation domain-containing protein
MRSPHPPAKRATRRAFTLVEVILAMLIFSLLAGAVFMSVSAVSNASAILGTEQMNHRKLDALVRWCRRGFANLSSQSEIFLRTRDAGAAGRAVELIIRRAPGAFSLGEFDARGSDILLSAMPDGRGGAAFSLARLPGGLSGSDFDQALAEAEWFPILEGIRTLRWEFWNPTEQRFEEEWPEGRPLPELIRLQLTLVDGNEIGATFRLPRLTQPAVNPAAPPAPDPTPTPEP